MRKKGKFCFVRSATVALIRSPEVQLEDASIPSRVTPQRSTEKREAKTKSERNFKGTVNVDF